MADYRGIEGVSNALVHLLRMSYQSTDFDNELQFEVYVHESFTQPMAAGVSVFLYRVVPNGTWRIPSGRVEPGGRRFDTKLPLDLHYMMTIWARDASLEHRVTGWMMRTLEDTPILPFGLLEAAAAGIFQPDETVELVLGELSNEDLFRIWDTLGQSSYHLSIPYIARNVRVASSRLLTAGDPVQERRMDRSTFEVSVPSPGS
jgi:hypothetical protein